MIILDNVLICDSIYTIKFKCDLDKCKGQCCVIGHDGPMVTEKEIEYIKQNKAKIFSKLSIKSLKFLENNDFYYKKDDHYYFSLLDKDQECIFSIKEKDITLCAIQIYKFKKPFSCSLFPLYLKPIDNNYYLTYRDYEECKTALDDPNAPLLYKVCKNELIEFFGENWYNELSKRIKFLLELEEIEKNKNVDK